jgi:hypothetical protein
MAIVAAASSAARVSIRRISPRPFCTPMQDAPFNVSYTKKAAQNIVFFPAAAEQK